MEALKSGAVDATYVGPDRPRTPSSTAAAVQAIRVVAARPAAAAFLVVRPGITRC